MPSVFVKICGLTNPDDTLAAVDGGAAALGFNFFTGSPRYLDPDASQWIRLLPTTAWKVGVFVNERPARIAEIAQNLALDIVQLHGDESPADCPPNLRVWKAACIDDGFSFSAFDDFPAEALLLDGPRGGSGSAFDWSRAEGSPRPVVIAGGLDPSNVTRAIRQLRPWGVDVCSRIESSPGIKDRRLMAAFIRAALSENLSENS